MNLVRRGCDTDLICTICGEGEEDVNHLFLQCRPCVVIWYTSPLGVDMTVEKVSSLREFIWIKMNSCPTEYSELLAFIAWDVWKHKCGVCMEGGKFSEWEILHKTELQWQNWTALRQGKKEQRKKVNTREGKWNKPQQNTCKLNCDVAVTGEGRVVLGYVIRDDQANVVLAGKKEEEASGSSTLLEGRAMSYALQMSKQYGIQIATVERDSKALIDAVNCRELPPQYCDVIIGDIRSLAKEVECNSFEFIPRESNTVAHQAARGDEFLSIRHTHAHLSLFVLLDNSQ